MMKALVLMLSVLVCVFAQGPIDGVYYSDLPNSNCRVYAQIHLMNFLSYLGPCGGNNGQVLMGSYVIAPTAASATSGVLSVTYATKIPTNSGGPIAGNTYSFTWFFVDGASKTMLNITSTNFAVLQSSILFIRNTASAIDGTWAYVDNAGVHYEIEAQANTYLSYTTGLNGPPGTTMGTFELPSPGLLDVYLTYGPAGFSGTKENGTYTVTPTALNVVVTVEAANNAVVSLGPYSKVPSNAQFEGVWSGFTTNNVNGYCLTIAEFRANLWRGYQTRCDSSYSFGFGTFLGTFNQLSSTAVNLTYNFVDFHDLSNPPNLEGQTLTFSVGMGTSPSGATTLSLTRTEGGTTTVVQLTKVTTMPGQSNVEIHLQGNYTAFIGQVVTDFVNALAASLGIDPRNIRIADIRQGSIIVDVEIQDDVKNGVSASTATAILSNSASIGGYPVIGVTNNTPGASSAAMHVVASWLVLAALVMTALLM